MALGFPQKAAVMAAAASAAGVFDFSTLGTLVADYDGSAGITVTGSGVSTWADQSGSGNDATQTTDADRPADGGDVLGFNAVDFDNSNTEHLDTPVATSAAMTIFVVGQVGSAPDSNNDTVIGSGAGSATRAGWQFRHHTDTHMDFRAADGTSRIGRDGSSGGAVNLGAGANFIAGARYDGSNAGFRINGNTASEAGHSLGSVGTDNIDIGAEGPTPVAGSHWDGEVVRVLIYSNRLDDTNFATAFTELNAIYGVF